MLTSKFCIIWISEQIPDFILIQNTTSDFIPRIVPVLFLVQFGILYLVQFGIDILFLVQFSSAAGIRIDRRVVGSFPARPSVRRGCLHRRCCPRTPSWCSWSSWWIRPACLLSGGPAVGPRTYTSGTFPAWCNRAAAGWTGRPPDDSCSTAPPSRPLSLHLAVGLPVKNKTEMCERLTANGNKKITTTAKAY